MKATRNKGLLLDGLAVAAVTAPPPLPRYTLVAKAVATPGNLCVIGAQPKVGKSALVGAFLAAAMGASGDTLGIGSGNPEGHAVIHFDTEQSPDDHRNLIATALRRAGTKERPTWLRSYRIAGVPIQERFALLDYEVRRAHEAHGGVHSVLLDSVADFLMNPNDSAKAFGIVGHLHVLAAEVHTSVVCVLHLNPGSTAKTRGHLGSQLERKAETNILLEKRDGISTIYTQSARHAPIRRIDGHQFRWCDEAQMHVSYAWNWKGAA